jgi:DNA adenine methylase
MEISHVISLEISETLPLSVADAVLVEDYGEPKETYTRGMVLSNIGCERDTTVVLRPFLKWAGAKTRIVERIRETYAQTQPKRLIEPFLGSCAVALNLNFSQSLLADRNQDLVDVYKFLKRDCTRFVAACERLFVDANNIAERYYALREEFNTTKLRWRRATLFVYLNRHGFNGLCRYNADGQFNVPFGKYTKPYFPRTEMLALGGFLRNADIECSDFRGMLSRATRGDFVYCDPPYVPVTQNGFTAYASGGFTFADQKALAELAEKAADQGATVAISNHDTPEIRELYREHGARVKGFLVSRTISCDGKNRQKAKEIIAVFGGAS